PATFWCADGGTRTIGTMSPQTFGPVRHVFLSWSDGGAQSHPVTCTAPTTHTAAFAREYEMTVDTIPAALQVEVDATAYAAPHTFWCREADARVLSVSSPQGTGGTRYPFVAWTDGLPQSHAIACDQPATFTAIFGTEHQVTIATSPPGLEVVIDGVPWTAPQTFWWGEGSIHTVNATTPQGLGRSRWAFASWSDGGAANRTVGVTSPRTHTATFVTEHEVTFSSTPAGLEILADGVRYALPRTFWWRNGSAHTIAVESPQGGPPGTRYVFASWSDGRARNRTISVTAPTDLVASFGTQYQLTATSPHGIPSCDAPGCWYDAGRTAALQIEWTVSEPPGTQYRFFAWTGDVGAPNPIVAVLMDRPKSTVATWTTEYLLTVISAYGNATGGDYYLEGETASFAVVSTESVLGGVRYRFLRWTGDVNTTARGGTILMDGPKTVVAQWEEVPDLGVGSWIWIIPAIVAVFLFLLFLWLRRRRKEEGEKAPGEPEGGGDSPDLEDELDLDAGPEG
ncbi:MAG: hypothetical protein AABY30_04580, partial [Candidatus Thermoplasmatota archaeon]